MKHKVDLSVMTNEFISERLVATVFNWRNEFKQTAKALLCDAYPKNVAGDPRGSKFESWLGYSVEVLQNLRSR